MAYGHAQEDLSSNLYSAVKHMDDLRQVKISQPNLTYGIVVRIKWVGDLSY